MSLDVALQDVLGVYGIDMCRVPDDDKYTWDLPRAALLLYLDQNQVPSFLWRFRHDDNHSTKDIFEEGSFQLRLEQSQIEFLTLERFYFGSSDTFTDEGSEATFRHYTFNPPHRGCWRIVQCDRLCFESAKKFYYVSPADTEAFMFESAQQLTSDLHEHRDDCHTSWMARVKKYARGRIAADIDLDEIANRCGVSLQQVIEWKAEMA